MKLADIVEGVNDYVVYHNFTLTPKTEPAVMDILNGGALKALTPNRIDNLHNTRLDDNNIEDAKSGRMVYGTSFTRDRQLAMSGEFGELFYEVDLRKIKETNKVVPIDDLTDTPHHDLSSVNIRIRTAPNMGLRTESEEFVIGDIPRFANAIKRIHYLSEGSAKRGFDRKVERLLASFKKQYPHIEIVDHYASVRRKAASEAKQKSPKDLESEIAQLKNTFIEAKTRFEEVRHTLHGIVANGYAGDVEYLQQEFDAIGEIKDAAKLQKVISNITSSLGMLHRAVFKVK